MPKIEFTHLDKIFYPQDKITKEDIYQYYVKAFSKMKPHLINRPIVMERYPDGIQKPGFFQKNVPEYFPSWIHTVQVPRKQEKKGTIVLCQNKDTLAYLVNQGCITFHTWLCKKTHLDKPDRIVFDIDPPQGGFSLAKKAAQHLRTILEKRLKMKTFLMTTGSKGLHIHIPIKPSHTFAEIKQFAKIVAQKACLDEPKLFTIEPRKTARKGKVFIDYLRNEYAQHSVAPYTLRPIEKAPIATPISWDELTSKKSQSFHIKNIGQRLNKIDPWKDFFSSPAPMGKLIKEIASLLK